MLPDVGVVPDGPTDWLARVASRARAEPTMIELSLPLSAGSVAGTATVRSLDDGHVVVVLGRVGTADSRDPLTGLADRRAAHAAMEAALVVPGRRIAVLFMDLDGFKAVNDTLGHDAGDHLLVEIAQRMAAELRHGDVLARFGGDEFVAVLDGLDDPGVAAVARRLGETVARPVSLDGHEVRVSVSIGIASGTGGVVSPRSLLHQADLAMYAAKARGRSRATRYHPSMARPGRRHPRPVERAPIA
jgi:diguanylate cyclase (GGDEF)-like protein